MVISDLRYKIWRSGVFTLEYMGERKLDLKKAQKDQLDVDQEMSVEAVVWSA